MRLYQKTSHYIVFAVVSFVAIARPVESYALASDALSRGAGTKPVPISKLVEERKLRLEIEDRLKKEAEIKRKQDEDVAARKVDNKNKNFPETVSSAIENARSANLLSGVSAKDKNIPSAVVPEAKKAEDVVEPVESFATPSMVILFDRKRVYFGRGLERLLDVTERSKKAVHYSVVSEIPADAVGGKRNERVWAMYEANLRDVMQQFNLHGVQASRISVVTRATEKVTAHTVSIYQD